MKRGGGGVGGAVVSVLNVLTIFLFIKENWICAMNRHHAGQTLIYYWQDIFLLILVSGSEAIL